MRDVEREFDVSIPPEESARITNFRKPVAHLDAKTG